MDTIGKSFVGIILIIVDFIVGGLFLMMFWKWFIVPAFGVEELSFRISVGVAFFIGAVLKPHKIDTEEKDMEDIISEWFVKIIYTAVIFLVGLSLYQFLK